MDVGKGFDYKKAIELVKSDFNIKLRDYSKDKGVEYRHSDIILSGDRSVPAIKLQLLDALKTETLYYDASKLIRALGDNLTEDERMFYSRIIVEQGMNDPWGRGHGMLMLFKTYNEPDGILKQYMSSELYKDVVNEAFWHFLNEYYHKNSALQVPSEWYNKLMDHVNEIDMTRMDEFKKEPLRYRRDVEFEYKDKTGKNVWSRGWPDERYMKLFDSVKDKLTYDQAAWMATPIIEGAIYPMTHGYLTQEETIERVEKEVRGELARYKDYIKSGTVQTLLKDLLYDDIHLMSNDFDGDVFDRSLLCINLLKDQINLKGNELKEVFRKAILAQNSEDDRESIIWNLGPEWVTKDLSLWVLERRMDRVMESAKVGRFGPALIDVYETAARGFTVIKDASEKYETAYILGIIVGRYLEKKTRPSGWSALQFIQTLKPDGIEVGIYNQAMNTALADLVKRRKFKEATEWYKKLEKLGILEKEKIPSFGFVVEEKEEKKNSHKSSLRPKRNPHSHRWALWMPKVRKIYQIPNDGTNHTLDEFLREQGQE